MMLYGIIPFPFLFSFCLFFFSFCFSFAFLFPNTALQAPPALSSGSSWSMKS